jgi:hypothetical protein
MTDTRSLSIVATRVIKQAKALGLIVEVQDNNSDRILQSYTVKITRPQVETPQNMLDVVRNAEQLSLHLARCHNEGRWHHGARTYSYTDYSGTKITLRSIKYRLEGMAD